MMKQRNRLFLLVFIFLIPGMAAALQFKPVPAMDQELCESEPGLVCVALLASGEIKSGDLETLQSEVQRASTFKGLRIGEIWLDSLGGDVREAMRLGRYIRSQQLGTIVTRDSTCGSACVLIYAAGVKRVPTGPIIIHSFYSKEFEGTGNLRAAEKKYDEMASEIELYLREMRITKNLLDRMMSIPHFHKKTLSIDEMEELGLIGYDPVYAQVRKKKSKP